MDKILTFNGKIATGGGRWIARAGSTPNPYNPYNLAPRTIRFEMPAGWSWSDPSSIWSYYTWTQVSSSPNVWDVYVDEEYPFVSSPIDDNTNNIILGANLSSGLELHFNGTSSLSIRSLYCGTGWSEKYNTPLSICHNITDCRNVDFGDATSLRECFASSKTTLTLADNFKMENVTDLREFMYGCRVLAGLPSIYGATQVSNCNTAFSGCRLASSGIVDMYNKLSGQSTPPSDTFWAFQDCGSGTAAGQAELAQIPDAWK